MEALILNPGSAPLSRNIEDYPDGIIIPIDKPYRWTSADVIRKVKYAAIRHFGKKNLKVGHAGTLDPLATGVLLVCIGKATKLAETLQSHDKEYIAGVTFGATTPSYDLEKEIDRMFPYEHITAESIQEVLPAFIGEQDQVAPLFSAKSVDGIRAYELARKLHKEGKTLDEAAQELIRTSRITISDLELLEFNVADCRDSGSEGGRGCEDRATRGTEDGVVSDQQMIQRIFAANSAERSGGVSEANVRASLPSSPAEDESIASSRINITDNSELGLPHASIRMACSKGTYVRAFARDLGETLNSGAHLDSLQRSRSGIFRVENALSIEQTLEKLAQ